MSNQTPMREYFELGTKLANQHGLGAKVLQKFREANRRSVQIKMLRPDPETAKHVRGWHKLYVEAGRGRGSGQWKPESVHE